MVEEFDKNSPAMTVSNLTSASGEACASSGHIQNQNQRQNQNNPTTTKKKRNLPGMPDPGAEVIALSPKTLMATNRFVCEICNKGFQRDQNLQLHRRGHNLPWKLRQRSGKEIKKRVYICPEPSCVHHEPSRALGDLTGIKKHYCRKHGEKKWKCEKCSKRYAVQSDWKAHSKTCGTREYRCDCGTLFSRRDSFITHRAFCDALAEESAKTHVVTEAPANSSSEEDPKLKIPSTSSKVASNLHVRPVPQDASPENSTSLISYLPATTTGANGSMFASLFSSTGLESNQTAFSDLIGAMTRSDRITTTATAGTSTTATVGTSTTATVGTTTATTTTTSSSSPPVSLCLSSSIGPTLTTSLFSQSQEQRHYTPPSAHMSATALLQKAAQMGATATNSSLLRGFGLSVQQQENQWPHYQEEARSQQQLREGLMQSLPAPPMNYGAPSGPPAIEEVGMQEMMFAPLHKPATLDLLGMGMGSGGTVNGFSALITSISNGGIDMSSFGGGGGGGGGQNNAGNSPGKWERELS